MTSSEAGTKGGGEALAKILGRELGSGDILERLILMKKWESIQDCLDQFLIEAEFDRLELALSDDELHKKLTGFRRENGLLTGDETKKWLEKHHMSDDHFVQMCISELKREKLKEKLVAARLQEYFVYKRLELLKVELYRIVVAGEEAAREILSSVLEGASFFDYARKYSIDAASAKSCGYMGKISMNQLDPKLQDHMSKAKAGSFIGPFKKADKSFEIYFVEEIILPELAGELKAELEEELFLQYLLEMRARANIELFLD